MSPEIRKARREREYRERVRVQGLQQQELAGRLSAALHDDHYLYPCLWACTHVLQGEWTAAGVANVLSRHESESPVVGRVLDGTASRLEAVEEARRFSE